MNSYSFMLSCVVHDFFLLLHSQVRHRLSSTIMEDGLKLPIKKLERLYEPRCEKTGLRGFPTRFDTNRAVQPQKMARGLKFRIKEVGSLYYLYSENKGADQLCGYRTADLRLCFRICKSRFSHDEAHTTCI